MTIFDNVRRTLSGGASRLVGRHEYLNLSARPEASQVRALIEDWVSRYPAEHQSSLVRRLQSVEEGDHISAFFELSLHELLLRTQCTVVAVEPPIPDSQKSPDFLVRTASGDEFYLEATLAAGQSQESAGAKKRLKAALHALDAVRSPDFFLAVSHRGVPSKPLSGRKLKAKTERWLAGLNYDEVLSCHPRGLPAPHLDVEEYGLKLRIEPIPRNHRGAHTGGRAIGVSMLGPSSLQPSQAIRNSVCGKSGRYGNLDRPYIIAVNALYEFSDEDDAIDALFGSDGVQVVRTDQGWRDEPCRLPDGAWQDQRGPRNTRVSAVLSTERLDPWSVAQRRMRLILNPFAQKPLAGSWHFTGDMWTPHDTVLRKEAGKGLGDIFGLPDGWPESSA